MKSNLSVHSYKAVRTKLIFLWLISHVGIDTDFLRAAGHDDDYDVDDDDDEGLSSRPMSL